MNSQRHLAEERIKISTAVLKAYLNTPEGTLDNKTLYEKVADAVQLNPEQRSRKVAIGNTGALHSELGRKVRWVQQSLKQAGMITKVADERGLWGITSKASKELNRIDENAALVAYSTELGIAMIGWCRNVFNNFPGEIHLALTSPPYPIRQARAYGNPTEKEYVDWLLFNIEPLVSKLTDGGSLCLQLSNDIFLQNSPARSLYVERLVLALNDKLGLQLMDRMPWINLSKPPGPRMWASKNRVHLNVGHEMVLWFTNNPAKVTSNNQRVLKPHSDRHLKLIEAGGFKGHVVNSDGAYRKYDGSYGNPTAGAIPKNVLEYGHACGNQRGYQKAARHLGLPSHGASFPLRLVMFLIEFLTSPGQLVVDPFAGSNTVGLGAELLGRQWLSVDNIVEYVLGSALRFTWEPSFNFELANTTVH